MTDTHSLVPENDILITVRFGDVKIGDMVADTTDVYSVVEDISINAKSVIKIALLINGCWLVSDRLDTPIKKVVRQVQRT